MEQFLVESQKHGTFSVGAAVVAAIAARWIDLRIAYRALLTSGGRLLTRFVALPLSPTYRDRMAELSRRRSQLVRGAVRLWLGGSLFS